jgi:hypothetical protein
MLSPFRHALTISRQTNAGHHAGNPRVRIERGDDMILAADRFSPVTAHRSIKHPVVVQSV